ncbi:MAG: dihydropteroate synthase [Sphingobacteriales bacterium]|nr:dihydropteroate synthase [Sphingobacteriales bacterium]
MFSLNCQGRLLVVDKPLVMGILNITPDSFYTGSRFRTVDEVLRRAEQMLNDGARILDMGGQSTRPGSVKLDPAEEGERVLAPIEAVRRHFPEVFISVDTYYASVAEAAVNAGADLVNDISAGTLDENMIPAVARLQVPYVLMHMKGSPQTMQQEARYTDVTRDVLDFLAQKKAELNKAGIKDILIDPGFGFGKTPEHNFTLLRNLRVFQLLQAPLLLGISRKSFIWKTLGVTPDDALSLQGSTALHMAGLMNGAAVLRVHDVKEAVGAIRLYSSLYPG